ncbi:YegP family protein [Chitinophaga barathri]|uniref:DUF1508 domain-containing protein n=1 Tax=Chitinophaga barathri TaxID=1647451 RepID=A0A3N4M5J2_9BACT|nr:YegP family protein [Chitinophaga barathri]RPD38492.1 DUF1508 domain-containing protein [Chitinophaga barathri]
MGKFVIANGPSGSFYFNLKAGNGEVILTSEHYTTKDKCLEGVASVKRNAVMDRQYEDRTANDGRLYFVLKGGNQEVIGTSQMYQGSSGRETGKASVKANAAEAAIEEE